MRGSSRTGDGPIVSAPSSSSATSPSARSAASREAKGRRQRAHYDGLPVDFIADAISTLGARVTDGFETYHVMNPHDDGISLDTYVDWLIDAGRPITRIADYGAWLTRFETALRALPDRQRHASVLPLLASDAYHRGHWKTRAKRAFGKMFD